MPATLELDLELDTVPTVYPARIHGAACALLGHPPPGGRPDFSAWPLLRHGDHARWRLGWLPDSPCPPRPISVTFGASVHGVVGHSAIQVRYAELAATQPARRAEIDVLSPMYFSRSGRDLPIPDPELMLRSALDRWDRHAPPALGVPDEVRRALLGSVYVAAFEGGTVSAPVGTRTHQTGFTGSVTLALTRAADTATATLFAALIRYAEVAGVGAQTAHGFGAVRTRLLGTGTDQLGRAGNRAGPRNGVSAGGRRVRRSGQARGDHSSDAGEEVLAEADNAAAQGA